MCKNIFQNIKLFSFGLLFPMSSSLKWREKYSCRDLTARGPYFQDELLPYVTHWFPHLATLMLQWLAYFYGNKKNIYFFGWFEINRWSDQWRKTVFSFVEGTLNTCFQLVQKLFKDSSTFFIFYIVSTVSHMRNIQLIVNIIQLISVTNSQDISKMIYPL